MQFGRNAILWQPKLLLLLYISRIHSTVTLQRNETFPSGFIFGASTAAYQIEGAWNVDGKGASIWDELMHEQPDIFAGNVSSDVGADSYHQFEQDIAALQETGVSVCMW